MILRLSLIAAAFLLTGCITDRSFSSGMNDTGIDLALKTALFEDTNYDTSDIDLTVFEGRVMLTGTVRSDDARRDIGMKARSVEGVTEIINEVNVAKKTSIPQGTRDIVIDGRLAAALKADNGVYRSNYQFAVSNGIVYVIGIAQGPREYERVVGHAQTIPNVSGVVPHVVFVKDPRRPE